MTFRFEDLAFRGGSAVGTHPVVGSPIFYFQTPPYRCFRYFTFKSCPLIYNVGHVKYSESYAGKANEFYISLASRLAYACKTMRTKRVLRALSTLLCTL